MTIEHNHTKFDYQQISHVTIARCGYCDKPTNGQMHIAFGHVQILILNHVKSIEKRAAVMENILPQSVNAIKITMVHVANIGMSVHQIRIVAYKENALTLAAVHSHASNAIANWDGLVRDAIKVRIASISN
jgi:hypothetical protein